MSKLNAKYLAGFIDGEGCIRIDKSVWKDKSRSTCYKVQVVIGHTCLEPLASIQKQFGGSLRAIKRQKKEWKDAYMLQLTGQNARVLLNKIAPHVIVKKEQLELAQKFGSSITRGIPAPGKRISKEELELRECFYQEMKKLNSKGKSP